MTTPPPPGTQAALEHLATALGPGLITVVSGEPGRAVRLTVTCRATHAAGDVYADEGGCYWWPWAERIAATDDPQTAAHQVAAALRGTTGTAGPW